MFLYKKLDCSHNRRPVHERPESPASAKWTEVFRSDRGSQDFLSQCGGISSVLCYHVLGVSKKSLSPDLSFAVAVIDPGSKGRNGESLIKMLNKDGMYRRKGGTQGRTVGGRKQKTWD